jgi:hypothetical protein
MTVSILGSPSMTMRYERLPTPFGQSGAISWARRVTCSTTIASLPSTPPIAWARIAPQVPASTRPNATSKVRGEAALAIVERISSTFTPSAVFVADDLDAAWNEIGPYLLHDARAAAAFRHGEEHVASISRASSVAELRAEAGAYRVLSVAQASERLKFGKSLGLLPLCGGMPPDIAWPYLERAAHAVAMARG